MGLCAIVQVPQGSQGELRRATEQTMSFDSLTTLFRSLNPRGFLFMYLKHPVPFHSYLRHNQKHISGENLVHVFMLSQWLLWLCPSIKNTFYLMSQYIHIWLKIKYHATIPSLTGEMNSDIFLFFQFYLFCIQVKIQ